MNRFERWCLHLAALATAGTGLMDGLLRWFGERPGEFGPEVHPWLGTAQHLHVLVAPILVFTLGMMGLGAAILIAPMVISGVGIQVVTSPVWRSGMAWTHGTASGAFLLAYFGHLAFRGWQPTSLLMSRRQQG